MGDVMIRAIEPDELPRFIETLATAFHDAVTPEWVESETMVAEPDRYLVALDGDRFVGTAGACTTRFTVPGGSVTAPGITAVGVVPSHRRRRINTELMRAQLDDAARRGEPLAYLWASESPIYGRFGYGMASLCAELEVSTDRSALVQGTPLTGTVHLLPREEALPMMRPAYDAAAATRPGMIALDDRWWEWLFRVSKEDEDEPRFYAVHVDDDGTPDGFAVYRVKHDWRFSVPSNELKVQRMICANTGAEAALWRFLFDVDLIATVKAWDRPVDDTVLWLVQEPRRLRFTVADGLWVRLLDVPASLAARRYAADGRLVVEVRDGFRPSTSGRYELVVEDGSAACRPTDAEPDLRCDIAALGAAYLGGPTVGQLHRAHQVEQVRQGAVARATTMFSWEPSPWFGFVF